MALVHMHAAIGCAVSNVRASDCPRFSYATKNRGILRFSYPPKPGFVGVKNRVFIIYSYLTVLHSTLRLFSCPDVVGCSQMRNQSLIRISLTSYATTTPNSIVFSHLLYCIVEPMSFLPNTKEVTSMSSVQCDNGGRGHGLGWVDLNLVCFNILLT